MHTHTLYLSLYIYLSLSITLSLSLYHSLSFYHSLSLSIIPCLFLSFYHSISLFPSFLVSFSLYIHSIYLFLSHSISLSFYQSISLSITHESHHYRRNHHMIPSLQVEIYRNRFPTTTTKNVKINSRCNWQTQKKILFLFKSVTFVTSKVNLSDVRVIRMKIWYYFGS